jgi:spore germination protein KB
VVVLVAVIVFSTGFLATARLLTPVAGTAAWISVLLGGVIGLVIAWLVGSVSSAFPEQNLVKIAEDIFGKPFGKVIGLTFALYCTVVVVLGTREFVLAISISFLERTPFYVITAVFFILASYAAYLGIEAIARVCFIFFGVVIISIAILGVFAIPVLVPGRLLPLAGRGVIPIMRAALLTASYTGEAIVSLAFLRHLKDKRHVSRAVGTGVAIGTAIMAMTVAYGIMMLGTGGISRVTYPAVETARMVGAGEFLERGEILFLALWFSVAILKLASVFYAAITAIADLLNLDNYRRLILPFGIISMVLSSIPANVAQSFAAVEHFLKYTVWYAIALPALLLIGARMLRHEKGGTPDDSR